MEPAAWERVYRRADLTYSPPGALNFVGILETKDVSTNFDVLIDFSSAIFIDPAILKVSVYAFATAGSGRVQRAQYSLVAGTAVVTPGTSPYAGFTNPASTSFITNTGASGAIGQLLIQVGGLAALGWGLDLACTGISTVGYFQKLIVTGIAHGREL